MSQPRHETDESHISTDRETIRGWVGEHDATPVRYSGVEGESGTLRIVPESRMGGEHERLTLDEFFEEVEGNDQVVVYHGANHPEPFEVTEREAAMGRTTVSSEEADEKLMEGETVTSEVHETKVVERTIVEEVTVESEVVDREMVSEEIVDVELLTRDVVECELVDGEADLDRAARTDLGAFETGGRTTFEGGLGVEVVVDEGWTVTREVVERPVIESRVVGAEATETETVESDTVESPMDLEGVQRAVVESDLIDTEAGFDEVETATVESEHREGEVVETRLVERKTVEDEVGLRRRLTGELTEAETTSATTISREVVESELIEEWGVDEEITASIEEEASGGTTVAGEVESTRPTEDEEGKTVVDATGEEVGLVVDVRDGTLYVEPHPSLADRIMTSLGWGDADEDDYPIEPDRIAAITDDRVELSSVEPEAGDESE